MTKVVIQNLVDWGRSFVDENGSFYCGTTNEQKSAAARVVANADMWLYLTDVHPRDSPEFSINGGLYPVHNLMRRDSYDLDKLGVSAGKTVSPELTSELQKIVYGKRAGLLIPRHVFFQNYNGGVPMPCFSYSDIEDTFGVKKLDPAEFLDGDVRYIINAKHLFDGSAVKSTGWMGSFEGIDSTDSDIFTLLQRMYGLGEDLEINHTGVVTGICVYNTASGVKQKFPRAKVNIIIDATTQLLVPELGFDEKKEADETIRRMCKQIGINCITDKEYLGL